MEKEKYNEEEEIIILPPYWWVEYVDDCGQKHIATVKDKNYVDYLKETYEIIEEKIIQV